MRAVVPALAAPLLLGGCITLVNSQKADGTVDGIEYSLPIPIVAVTPQTNGTMKVSVEYVPDEEHTYVIRSRSYLSNYALDVQRENGMLKQVSLSGKSDAVAAAAIESAGNVVKAQADANAKEADAAQALATAQAKAVSDAQLEYDVAKGKFDLLTSRKAGADDLLTAEIAMNAAKVKLDHETAKASGSNLVGGNVPEGDESTLTAAAPVLFEVVPTQEKVGETFYPGVTLVALEGPHFLPTSAVAKPAAKAPREFALNPSGGGVVTVKKGEPVQLTLVATADISGVEAGSVKLRRLGGADGLAATLITGAAIDPAATKPTVIITFAVTIPAGTYVIQLTCKKADGEPVRGPEIQFSIAR